VSGLGTGGTPDDFRWFVVRSQPRKEALADLHLRRQGFSSYLPMIATSSTSTRASRPLRVAFFPGYLFVQLNMAKDRWRSINGTFGVSKLVEFGGGPAPVPRGLVETLMSRTAPEGVLGFEDRLEPGEDVRFVGGAFDGLLGVLQSTDAFGRVAVLMNVMSRSVPVVVSRGAVVRAA
jgi:transcriptional antiterminator RfaH